MKNESKKSVAAVLTAGPLAAEVLFDPLNIEEEGLFSRDIDGQLVRLVDSTASDYATDIHLKIDGRAVTVKKAVPTRDSQGNIVNDAEGHTVPRSTTIYDAASEVFVEKPGDVNPIPILCHREHMQPAAVCRVCVVEVFRTVDGKRRGAGSLVPACHHQVEEGMEVQTIESANDPESGTRVRAAVKVLTELLVADHLSESALATAADSEFVPNELTALAKRLDIKESRFARTKKVPIVDRSSLRILVDHSACILCERCMRGCSEIRENYVIGRAGKGYDSRIAFDLDTPMGESSCVSCGECMISCPTDALTFKGDRQSQQKFEPGESATTAEELLRLPMFAGIPFKFLQWNATSIVRQRLKKGEVLCEEGEYGRDAFLLVSGEFDVGTNSIAGRESKQASGWLWKWFGKQSNKFVASTSKPGGKSPHMYSGRQSIRLTSDAVIIGEMTCMSHYPRSATVTAATDAEVLRINRNVLYMLQRNEVAREILENVYRQRALDNQLDSISMLQSLSSDQRSECVAMLRECVEFARVDPGQVIFRQGEKANDFYMVRLGFVKVTQARGTQERVLNYLGPGSHFGEIGLVSSLTTELQSYSDGMDGRRTASCTALDDVELVRIRGEHFRELWKRFPNIQPAFLAHAKTLLERDREEQAKATTSLPEFLDQGLFNAQKLLVLDLEACTRCDECTKACSDTHDGVTRLIREGLRFDKWLVAGSCRSCLDPYCLVGCPVDAIHREGSLEIRIEDHCIGCGLCAQNCPYGNINMHGFVVDMINSDMADSEAGGGKRAVVQQKATTCDLCRDIVKSNQDPSCVYACPHNAAFRMSGEELLSRVQQG